MSLSGKEGARAPTETSAANRGIKGHLTLPGSVWREDERREVNKGE